MSKLEELKQQFDVFLPAINTLVEKQLDDQNIGRTISVNAMKSIIQQELLPVKQAMERANTRSLEVGAEGVIASASDCCRCEAPQTWEAESCQDEAGC
eukprot:5137224-Ditylum_brightwellii.AAC.1